MQAEYKAVQGGFTLIELIVTLSIASIVLAAALPMLQGFIRNQRKTAEVNLLIGALNFTRSEAIVRQRSLRLCGGNLIDGCQDERLWRSDWLVLTNERTGKLSEPLQVFTRKDDFFWRWSGAGRRPFIRFKADGSAAGSNGTFTLCYEEKALHQVVVNFAGRIRSQVAPEKASCD